MPRVSVYLNKDVYERARYYAEEKGASLSGFIKGVLKEHLDNTWTEGYFEKYVGILKDDPIEIPEELPWELDAHRQKVIDEFAEYLDSLPEGFTPPSIFSPSRQSPPEE